MLETVWRHVFKHSRTKSRPAVFSVRQDTRLSSVEAQRQAFPGIRRNSSSNNAPTRPPFHYTSGPQSRQRRDEAFLPTGFLGPESTRRNPSRNTKHPSGKNRLPCQGPSHPGNNLRKYLGVAQPSFDLSGSSTPCREEEFTRLSAE